MGGGVGYVYVCTYLYIWALRTARCFIKHCAYIPTSTSSPFLSIAVCITYILSVTVYTGKVNDMHNPHVEAAVYCSGPPLCGLIYGLLPSSGVQWLQLTTTACSWKDRILLFSPLYSESLDLLILAQPVIGLDGINEPFSSCCVCIVFLWSHSPSCPHTLQINLWHMRVWVDYHNIL